MCVAPIQLKKTKATQSIKDTFFMQQVPCGTCVECMKRRVNGWFVRLMSEYNDSTSAYFVTLTYNDESIPFSENGLMTLQYKDFQNFVKRYRTSSGDKNLKYYLVGEYGESTYRPHYHLILYNCSDINRFVDDWHNHHGHTHVGTVKPQSVYYTLKYAMKRIAKINKKDKDDDRLPEKALISKKLGLNYLSPQMVKHFKDDVTRPVTLLGNKKLPLPRYYRDKIFSETEKAQRNTLLSANVADKHLERRLDPLYKQRVEKMNKEVINKLKKTD